PHALARQDARRADAAVKPDAAAQAPLYPSLKAQAEALGQAFIAGDYKKVAERTYPRLVEMAGGAKALADFLTREMQKAEADGFKVLSYEVGDPEPAARLGDALYAVVPTTMRAQTPIGVATQPSFMIGVSRDGGENWTFVGGTGSTSAEQLRVLLPEAWGKLKLPEVKPPTLEPKK
ncbi:MAG TPA: hypothetical protein VF521_01385, partial [Pyrinomonadaceae bacterium]